MLWQGGRRSSREGAAGGRLNQLPPRHGASTRHRAQVSARGGVFFRGVTCARHAGGPHLLAARRPRTAAPPSGQGRRFGALLLPTAHKCAQGSCGIPRCDCGGDVRPQKLQDAVFCSAWVYPWAAGTTMTAFWSGHPASRAWQSPRPRAGGLLLSMCRFLQLQRDWSGRHEGSGGNGV